MKNILALYVFGIPELMTDIIYKKNGQLEAL